MLQAASNGGGKTGNMTVSSPGLGQVALQIQQQVSVDCGVSQPDHHHHCLTNTVQSPQGPAGKMRGQQTAVQVVQQVNQAGQVVHKVLQAIPQSSSQPSLLNVACLMSDDAVNARL